jgi:cell division protein DivIC
VLVFENIKIFWESLYEKVPKPFRNFFVLTAVIFVLWMLLLDIDRMPRQWKKFRQNAELKSEVEYYDQKIEKGNEELKGLKDDQEKLERFAREKYFMHKKSEDVFVIEKKE